LFWAYVCVSLLRLLHVISLSIHSSYICIHRLTAGRQSSIYASSSNLYFPQHTELIYSQTFENRSSLPPNPPAGFEGAFDCVVVVVCAEAVGAALLQPPKSSSCATCGAPQPGLFGAVCDVVVVAAGWLGADDPQTSLLPHASMLDIPP
jgi:hypothetical protein